MIERSSDSPVNIAIGILAGKWKPAILSELRDGARRFGDLRRVIPGISEKVLSAHLRDLESDGIVSRREFRTGAGLATEYSFTDHGTTLRPILDALARWGADHQDQRRF